MAKLNLGIQEARETKVTRETRGTRGTRETQANREPHYGEPGNQPRGPGQAKDSPKRPKSAKSTPRCEGAPQDLKEHPKSVALRKLRVGRKMVGGYSGRLHGGQKFSQEPPKSANRAPRTRPQSALA